LLGYVYTQIAKHARTMSAKHNVVGRYQRSYLTSRPVSTGMGDCFLAILSCLCITSQLSHFSIASLRGRWIEYSLCSGMGGNVTSAGWQVTLCDPIWHVSARSGEAGCKLLHFVYFTLFLPARRYASAGISYGPVSVSVSVCHKSVFYWSGWTDRAGFWNGCFFRPVLRCVLRKFSYLRKWRYFRLELFRKFRT